MIGGLLLTVAGVLRSGLRMERRVACSGLVSTGFRSTFGTVPRTTGCISTYCDESKRHADTRRYYCSMKMSIEPGVEWLKARRSRASFRFLLLSAPAQKKPLAQRATAKQSRSYGAWGGRTAWFTSFLVMTWRYFAGGGLEAALRHRATAGEGTLFRQRYRPITPAADLQQDAEKVRQRRSHFTQRLNVPQRTPRLFARCGLADRPL
jgi:hypothetical protein